jgi:acyl carrier protein
MPEIVPTVDELLAIIETQLAWPLDRSTVNGESVLGPDGLGLDSILVIEAAITFEETFDVTFDDERIATLGQQPLDKIVELVRELQNSDA